MADTANIAEVVTDLVADLALFMNRLSDLLFAMARFDSYRSGEQEYLWEPGKR